MSLGSCLVTNEPLGMAEKIVEMRVNGSNWTEIKNEFGISSAKARELFTKGSGLTDFKLTGQKLKDLLNQGSDAIKQASEKAALKKVKKLDDVVPKKAGPPGPMKKIDLDKHDLDWPEPNAKSIKTELNEKLGYTDDDFDKILKSWKDGKSQGYIEATWDLEAGEFDKLHAMWKAEGKIGPAAPLPSIEASPFNYKPVSDTVLDGLSSEKLDQLYDVLLKEKNDTLFALQKEKSAAKKAWQNSGYDDALEPAYKDAVNAYAKYSNEVLPQLEADIKKIIELIEKKPALVPNIPINQPVKNKFINDVNLQQKTGLTQEQIDKILEMNKSGNGYLAIKNSTGIDFPAIDDVVWNDLLKKHDGFTWTAYVEKPTSESGFNAVKEKVFESRAKGLTIDEITAKPGAPPKPVIQAILDDKWKIPQAGAKAPIIPPPPPPPPQTWGGTLPSSGTDFKRHKDSEMLDWIRPDTQVLPRDHRSSISNYTNSGYHDINTYLRGEGLGNTSGYGYSNSNVVGHVQRIDATMRPIPVDITLTRNFTGVQYLPAPPQEMVGKVMWDDAFLSTSVKEGGVFSGDVQLIINAPQGTMGRYVNDISVHTNEQEMLLARGTRMVVTKVEKHGDGYSTRWRLFVDVVK